MSKKTSKTSHVLNILTSHNAEPIPNPIVKSEPTPELIAKPEPTPEPITKSEPTPEPITKSEPTPEPIAKSEPTPESVQRQSRETQPLRETESPRFEPSSFPQELSEQIKAKLVEETKLFSEGNLSPTDALDDKTASSGKQTPEPEEYKYFCVNILETIVKNRVIQHFTQSRSCLCSNCVNNAVALALNQLPPKYMVTTRGRLYVQATLYEKQHSVDISDATIQACTKVAAQPNHSHK